MVDRTTWGEMADGDFLKQGFFNSMPRWAATTAGQNTIRLLQTADQTMDLTPGQGEFAEAFIANDANGRENTVAVANSTALRLYEITDGSTTYNNYWVPGFTDDYSGDTTHDPDSYSNPGNAFDGSDSTYAEKTGTSNDTYTYLGKTFTSKYVYACLVKSIISSGGSSALKTLIIQTYDGVSWSTVATVTDTDAGANTIQKTLIIDDTIEGIRVGMKYAAGSGSPYHRLYQLEYGTLNEDSYVEMAVPSGTFSTDINSFFSTVLPKDIESDATFQVRLKNATDDSGFVAIDNVELMSSAFATGEPTTIQVKLKPATSSPTAGYPSMYGVYVREQWNG